MFFSSLMCGIDKSWIIVLVNVSFKEKIKKKVKDYGYYLVNGWRFIRIFL